MKPQWSIALSAVLELERQAEKLRTVALELRCGEEDSGGARCTADAAPAHHHHHRHDTEDLPK